MTPDEHPRRHHLANGSLLPRYALSPSLGSFGAASVMICYCSARPASSRAPPVLHEDRFGRSIIYNAWFCDLSLIHI